MYDHTAENGMVQEREGRRGRGREVEVGAFGLFNVMVSVRTYGVMYGHTVLNGMV